MNDSIFISNIEFWTRIGDPDDERKIEQLILTSVTFELDTKKAGTTDDLDDTIDYESVTKDILALRLKEHHLIENLAEDIAQMILDKYKPESVTVTVKKFPLPQAKEVSVTITRP